MFVPCDGGRNPMFYGQRRNIRKTKEQEMISTILDLVDCGITGMYLYNSYTPFYGGGRYSEVLLYKIVQCFVT